MNLNNNQFSNFLGKAVDRVARVGREVRDIPTAIGTALDPRTPMRGTVIKDIGNQLNDPIQAMGGQGQSSAYKNNPMTSYSGQNGPDWAKNLNTSHVKGTMAGLSKQDVTYYNKGGAGYRPGTKNGQRNDAYESAGINKDKAAAAYLKAKNAGHKADKAFEATKDTWRNTDGTRDR